LEKRGAEMAKAKEAPRNRSQSYACCRGRAGKSQLNMRSRLAWAKDFSAPARQLT
jgi:hypothetical protein